MRYIILFFLWALSYQLMAQSEEMVIMPNLEDGSLGYQEVVEVPGAASELSTKALAWVARTYKNSLEVIQHNDTSLIIGKGIMDVAYELKGRVYNEWVGYTFEIGFKEGKYRYTMRNMVNKNGQGDIALSTVYEGYKSQKGGKGAAKVMYQINHKRFTKIETQALSLMESLKNAMGQEKKDDW